MHIFNELIKIFEFLIKEFDFELIHKEKSDKYIGEYLVIFRNKTSKVQLEFSADANWFHCVIRRIIDGAPAKYSDKRNSVGFESLALLESNNNYNHFDYVIAGKGLTTVLKNTANLLKRHRMILTTESWIDVEHIKYLHDEELFRKFGVKAFTKKNELTFFEEIKKAANNLLTKNSYTLLMDSAEQPPYSHNSRPQKIIYNKENITFTIGQDDWRDFYYIYYISINNERCFEIDLSESNDTTYQIKSMMNSLIELVNKYDRF